MVVPASFDIEIASRDFCCGRFHASIWVKGRIAFCFHYRLDGTLTLRLNPRHARLKNTRSLAQFFGWKDLSLEEATALIAIFLQAELKQIETLSAAAHVVALARAGQFTRISNVMAAEHALLIRPYVSGSMKKRLLSLELLEEAVASMKHHWTRASRCKAAELPPL